MATTQIYVQAKKERIWVAKLREMPEGVFDLLIKRIAQGDSIRQIAKYCQTVRPEIAFETYREWLHALASQNRFAIRSRPSSSSCWTTSH